MRSLFLLKLVLIERAGLESRPLLEAQRALVLPAVEALETRLRQSIGTEKVFVRFRLETTRAVVDFIDSMLAEDQRPAELLRVRSCVTYLARWADSLSTGRPPVLALGSGCRAPPATSFD